MCCAIRDIAVRWIWTTVFDRPYMFRLSATMRRRSATGLSATWARCDRRGGGAGIGTLPHDDSVLRVMIVRNEIPPALVEWAER